jgi:hypothetical protein
MHIVQAAIVRRDREERLSPTGFHVGIFGIPHLAKNERDMGHPGFAAGTGF